MIRERTRGNLLIPGTQLTSIFESQPLKTRPFRTKIRVIWVPGVDSWLKIGRPKMDC